MAAESPEALHAAFARLFAARDLDGLVALYEPDALLFPRPGERVQGHAAIRAALGGFLAMEGRFAMDPPAVAQSGGVALIRAAWRLSAIAPDGQRVELAGETSDVARRQPDGSWRFAIDSPFGPAGLGR